MNKIHTHYDNLKVTRNAPPEVIRAAYKTLSQKYHPDKHPGNVNAVRVMSLINASYDVLSDPVQRAEHDRWIAEQESMEQQATSPQTRPSSPPPGSDQHRRAEAPPQAPPESRSPKSDDKMIRHLVYYGLGAFLVWLFFFSSTVNRSQGVKPSGQYTFTPSSVQTPVATPKFDTNFGRSELDSKPLMSSPPQNDLKAPNGADWPLEANYVDGYPLLNTGGLSSVTVDNSRNDSAVFAKLVALEGDTNFYPARSFYIPAHGSFTLRNVSSGNYDIRYRDLTSRQLSRSENFSLQEIDTGTGTQFSRLTMTLYKVQNGNMQTYRISESEF